MSVSPVCGLGCLEFSFLTLACHLESAPHFFFVVVETSLAYEPILEPPDSDP